MRVSSRAWVKVEANEIHGNSLAGLIVDGDAPPRVLGNTLHGNGGGGIVIKGSARGTYNENTVFACGQSGVALAVRTWFFMFWFLVLFLVSRVFLFCFVDGGGGGSQLLFLMLTVLSKLRSSCVLRLVVLHSFSTIFSVCAHK